ncbi:armadillo-type protein [Mycena vulgaris]|nr:armadillo-type protein [Mycena vulgaris]
MKSEAVLMKEDMAVATDDSQSESARINALDHLEALIEQIDNANNIEKLQMWTPLQALITSAPTSLIKMQALSVIGTALQNNPAAQDAYLAHDPLPVLASFIVPSPSSTAQTRSKAIYAISGLLKHNAPAVAALSRPDVEGWGKLCHALQDPDLGVRRKALFLLSMLLFPPPRSAATRWSVPLSSDTPSSATPDPVHANSHAASLADPRRRDTSAPALYALAAHGILDAIVAGLTRPIPSGNDGDVPGPDADFEEKGVALLFTYAVMCAAKFTPAQKTALLAWFEAERARDPAVAADSWGLNRGEFAALLAKVA